ncbi:dTDP-4-dehydrorhamnose reductase [Stomatohabitans albus]|uniref:dTDP-4-dehydrorhamnose reductase n=1 Tax=Stomatohabitans albus TaxID=3110766 RepID=UPI00300C870D
MARVIVTGAGGQLGTDLVQGFTARGHEVMGFTRQTVDLTDGPGLGEAIRASNPDIVINAAAYTAVDKAETDPRTAWQVNAFAPGFIAQACEHVGARLVQVSTDYVFNGLQGRPWTEWDNTDPQSVYGASKLAGERQAAQYCSRTYIVRTSWVLGEHGNNFAKTMLRLGRSLDELSVVDDQLGSPTFTVDLVDRIANILETEHYGTWHASNSGSCTWYELARQIFTLADITVDLAPTTTAAFNALAPRPANSVLANMMADYLGLPAMPAWEDSLEVLLGRITMEMAA